MSYMILQTIKAFYMTGRNKECVSKIKHRVNQKSSNSCYTRSFLLLARQGVGQAAETKAVEQPVETQGAEETVDETAEAETVELKEAMSVC